MASTSNDQANRQTVTTIIRCAPSSGIVRLSDMDYTKWTMIDWHPILSRPNANLLREVCLELEWNKEQTRLTSLAICIFPCPISRYALWAQPLLQQRASRKWTRTTQFSRGQVGSIRESICAVCMEYVTPIAWTGSMPLVTWVRIWLSIYMHDSPSPHHQSPKQIKNSNGDQD